MRPLYYSGVLSLVSQRTWNKFRSRCQSVLRAALIRLAIRISLKLVVSSNEALNAISAALLFLLRSSRSVNFESGFYFKFLGC